MTRRFCMGLAGLLASALLAPAVSAQPLGTFRWQLQPYCNVVTVAVTQNGAIYRLEGTDDQCGSGADAASVTGTAFPNPDGTIGFGLNIVTAPGGRPLHVDAEIALAALSGTWRDSAGATGTFAFTPGAGTGGTPRPLPSGVPSTILLRPDGGVVAGGTIGQGTIPASGPGTRMMWHPGKAAFRAGQASGQEWDDANVGELSVALGRGTRASGGLSTALGSATTASGLRSTAMGTSTIASGTNSTAMGIGTSASGVNDTAMGEGTAANGGASTSMGAYTTASGLNSTAMGRSTIASGRFTTAMGNGSVAAGNDSVAAGRSVTANGDGSVVLGSYVANRSQGSGSFLFGDRSTTDELIGNTPNQFLVRAAGGVTFYSNAGLTAGVQLSANGTQWSSLSDVRAKHRFRELDGDDVLARIAAMPVTEWSYKAQDDAIRHIGPTAQDFHAAFGLGEDPLRIGMLDAGGVALAAVKALETRTRHHAESIDRQAEDVASLKAEVARLRALIVALTGSPR